MKKKRTLPVAGFIFQRYSIICHPMCSSAMWPCKPSIRSGVCVPLTLNLGRFVFLGPAENDRGNYCWIYELVFLTHIGIFLTIILHIFLLSHFLSLLLLERQSHTLLDFVPQISRALIHFFTLFISVF